MADASVEFERAVREAVESIKDQVISRGYRVSNEMRNSVMTTLRGQRHGRIYRVPNTKRYYTASAPGEPPAVRTGIYRMSWMPFTQIREGGEITVLSRVESRYKVNGRVLGDMLERGTSKMAPRPHFEEIEKKSEQKAMRIYNEPYF